MTVKKAVIPAAGLGTRLLPATKVQPKEMVPVVDKPAIQYIVEGAVRAGLTDILIITGRGKSVMEDHFDRALELEQQLEAAGKTDELEQVRAVAELAEIFYVRQKEPLGFGHAVSLARNHVGDEAFAVMVPDEIIPEPRGAEKQFWPRMVDAHEKTGGSIIAVHRLPREVISSYGVIDPAGEMDEGLVKMAGMIEKPAADEAPSDLAALGHYIFNPEIFDALDRTTAGHGGEIQLTDGINLVARESNVHALLHDDPVYDIGKKLDYVKGTIEMALRRDDLAKPLHDYLVEVVAREG
ncbi:MAG: UTP--glucose-1-phosphate uridylyltransferase GalU [Actinomycetota bacterium]